MRTISISQVEFVAEDLTELAVLFVEKMGFRPAANPHEPDGRALHLVQGRAHVRLTPAASGAGEEDRFVSRHGSAVRDIGLWVSDVDATVRSVLASGGRLLRANGDGRGAVVQLFDGLRHTLSEAPAGGAAAGDGASGILGIDHVAICLEGPQFERILGSYSRAFGLAVTHEEYVATDATAMNSKVLSDAAGETRFVFLEPKPAARKSQIQAFMDHHGGPGVQHVAFVVGDILRTSAVLHDRRVQFLPVPPAYYEDLEDRVGPVARPMEVLRRHNILVDREANGLLFQAFTRHLFNRETFFVEFVERDGSTGFGSGNIKALFRAVERTMDQRAVAGA